MNAHFCPYHSVEHLTVEFTCPDPPEGVPDYVGWSNTSKARAAAYVAGLHREPRALPDPLLEGVGIDDRGLED